MPAPSPAWRVAVGRGVALMAVWVVLGGTGWAHLLVGVPTMLGAAVVSLRLLPPQPGRIRPWPLMCLLARLCRQSVLAGWDVARRALHPALPVRPGIVAAPCGLAPGMVLDSFLSWCALVPGTLPIAREADGTVRVHGLDVGVPVAKAMAEEEHAFVRAFGLKDGEGG